MTPAKRANQGGLKFKEFARISNHSRLQLDKLFNKNPLSYDELLIKAMRQNCVDTIFAIKLNLASDIAAIESDGL